MKDIIKFCSMYFILCLILLRCCAYKPSPKVIVDYYAMKQVNEFVEDAIAHGIRYDIIRDRVDDIVFYPLERYLYGMYVPSKKQIVLNISYAQDEIFMRKVIYHELGHLYGLRHDTYGIMSTGQEVMLVHGLYDPKYGGSQKLWDVHEAYLFHNIRLHLANLDKSK